MNRIRQILKVTMTATMMALGATVAMADGSKIFVIGGTNWEHGEKRWLDRVDVYDTEDDRWTSKAGLHRGPANRRPAMSLL